MISCFVPLWTPLFTNVHVFNYHYYIVIICTIYALFARSAFGERLTRQVLYIKEVEFIIPLVMHVLVFPFLN